MAEGTSRSARCGRRSGGRAFALKVVQNGLCRGFFLVGSSKIYVVPDCSNVNPQLLGAVINGRSRHPLQDTDRTILNALFQCLLGVVANLLEGVNGGVVAYSSGRWTGRGGQVLVDLVNRFHPQRVQNVLLILGGEGGKGVLCFLEGFLGCQIAKVKGAGLDLGQGVLDPLCLPLALRRGRLAGDRRGSGCSGSGSGRGLAREVIYDGLRGLLLPFALLAIGDIHQRLNRDAQILRPSFLGTIPAVIHQIIDRVA